MLSSESSTERDAWSKAILGAKNNNPVSGSQKMVYSRVPQEYTPESKKRSYFRGRGILYSLRNASKLGC